MTLRPIPALALVLLLLAPTMSWADCKTDYGQAIDMLETAKKKISNKEHPDQDAFSKDFKTMIDKLQGGKCMPELINLVQYIQGEQQKYPQPSGKKPAPVVD